MEEVYCRNDFAPKIKEENHDVFQILTVVPDDEKASTVNHWFYNFYSLTNEERKYIEGYFHAATKNK